MSLIDALRVRHQHNGSH